MVKRKADQSLDDWLKAGEEVARLNREAALATSEQYSRGLEPAADKVLAEGVNESEPAAMVEGGSAKGEACNWFWELLANVGYELC